MHTNIRTYNRPVQYVNKTLEYKRYLNYFNTKHFTSISFCTLTAVSNLPAVCLSL